MREADKNLEAIQSLKNWMASFFAPFHKQQIKYFGKYFLSVIKKRNLLMWKIGVNLSEKKCTKCRLTDYAAVENINLQMHGGIADKIFYERESFLSSRFLCGLFCLLNKI